METINKIIFEIKVPNGDKIYLDFLGEDADEIVPKEIRRVFKYDKKIKIKKETSESSL